MYNGKLKIKRLYTFELWPARCDFEYTIGYQRRGYGLTSVSTKIVPNIHFFKLIKVVFYLKRGYKPMTYKYKGINAGTSTSNYLSIELTNKAKRHLRSDIKKNEIIRDLKKEFENSREQFRMSFEKYKKINFDRFAKKMKKQARKRRGVPKQ